MVQFSMCLIFSSCQCFLCVAWMHNLCVPFVFRGALLLGCGCSMHIRWFPPHLSWTFGPFVSPISMGFHPLHALNCPIPTCIHTLHFLPILAPLFCPLFMHIIHVLSFHSHPSSFLIACVPFFFMRWQSPCIPIVALVLQLPTMRFSITS